MKYSEQKELMVKNNLQFTINIVHDVYWATNGGGCNISDKDFDIICSYVQYIYDHIDEKGPSSQLVSDIVCDLYLDLEYGYLKKDKSNKLTLEQMKNLERLDEIRTIYYNNI